MTRARPFAALFVDSAYRLLCSCREEEQLAVFSAGHLDGKRPTAYVAVLDESADRVRFDVDLDLLKAIWADHIRGIVHQPR